MNAGTLNLVHRWNINVPIEILRQVDIFSLYVEYPFVSTQLSPAVRCYFGHGVLMESLILPGDDTGAFT